MASSAVEFQVGDATVTRIEEMLKQGKDEPGDAAAAFAALAGIMQAEGSHEDTL